MVPDGRARTPSRQGRKDFVAAFARDERPADRRHQARRMDCRYKAEVKRLDDELARQATIDAEALIDAAFVAMASRNGSLDAVMVGRLNILALYVRSSWGVEHANTAERHFGIPEISEDEDELPSAVPILATDAERNRFVLQAKLFEGRGKTDGFVHQQLAKYLLAQEGACRNAAAHQSADRARRGTGASDCLTEIGEEGTAGPQKRARLCSGRGTDRGRSQHEGHDRCR